MAAMDYSQHFAAVASLISKAYIPHAGQVYKKGACLPAHSIRGKKGVTQELSRQAPTRLSFAHLPLLEERKHHPKPLAAKTGNDQNDKNDKG